METKSPWPLAMKFGLIIAFVHIIINLVFYFIDPEAAQKGTSTLGIIQLILVFVLTAWVFIYATKLRRDSELDGYITYNKSLGFMMNISLPAAFIISVYTYIFFAYINPGMMEKIMETQVEQMQAQGRSEEEIDMALSMAQKMSSPMLLTFFGVLGSLFQLFLVSLIAAIFTRKNPPVEA